MGIKYNLISGVFAALAAVFSNYSSTYYGDHLI